MRTTMIIAVFLLGATSAPVIAEQPERNPDGLSYAYVAGTDDAGNCQPSRYAVANAEGLGLYAIRGETVFALPAGDTNIPFQSVFNAFDDDGYSMDRATSVLNHPGPCSDLLITVTVEYCEYLSPTGYEERACPDIAVTGEADFSAIMFIRADLDGQ